MNKDKAKAKPWMGWMMAVVILGRLSQLTAWCFHCLDSPFFFNPMDEKNDVVLKMNELFRACEMHGDINATINLLYLEKAP